MPNLDVLKQRVGDAERRLHSAQNARARDCEALMNTWLQIQGRFEEQEREIAEYRDRLATLQDANVELTNMMGSLLDQLENTVGGTQDQTVPKIASLAKNFLTSEPKSDAARIDNVSGTESGEEDLSIPRPIVESEIVGVTAPATARMRGGSDYGREQADEYASDDDRDTDADVLELTEPADPNSSSTAGIRNLLSRIEKAVHRSANDARPDDTNGCMEEVEREVEEIELLRDELIGLREQISVPGSAT